MNWQAPRLFFDYFPINWEAKVALSMGHADGDFLNILHESYTSVIIPPTTFWCFFSFIIFLQLVVSVLPVFFCNFYFYFIYFFY